MSNGLETGNQLAQKFPGDSRENAPRQPDNRWYTRCIVLKIIVKSVLIGRAQTYLFSVGQLSYRYGSTANVGVAERVFFPAFQRQYRGRVGDIKLEAFIVPVDVQEEERGDGGGANATEQGGVFFFVPLCRC